MLLQVLSQGNLSDTPVVLDLNSTGHPFHAEPTVIPMIGIRIAKTGLFLTLFHGLIQWFGCQAWELEV